MALRYLVDVKDFVVAASLVVGATSIPMLCGCDSIDALNTNDFPTETRSELVTQGMGMGIPAYFADTDTTSWNPVIANTRTSQLVIVNGPNSGPPPSFDLALATHINQLSVRTAFGYVQFQYGRPAADIESDIQNWVSNYAAYGLGGIFFDVAVRVSPNDDVAKMEYFISYVINAINNPNRAERLLSIFNWGTVSANMQSYVNCGVAMAYSLGVSSLGVKFVTAEMTHDVYLAASTDSLFNGNSWLNQYKPVRFINIAYKNPNSSTWGTFNVNNLVAKAAPRNSGYMYVQDNTSSNLWGVLASSSTWTAEVSKIFSGTYSFPGTNTEPAGSGCPAPSPN